MTDDAHRFVPLEKLLGVGETVADPRVVWRLEQTGYLLLHEGKTISQFTDRWDTLPRYAVAECDLLDREQFLANSRHFRAACREIAGSTNEHTAIAAMIPPGTICAHTVNVERRPSVRPNASALVAVGLMNSFPFDWMVRQRSAAHVSLFILASIASPELAPVAERFLAHATLRLSCNHAGFAALWMEQSEGAWREASPRYAWPAVAAEQARWRIRAAMDAVVAHSYGLSHGEYEHVLASFSHKSFALAPRYCMEAFDELLATGIDAFCRANDPYDDIPVVTDIAQAQVMVRAEYPAQQFAPGLPQRSRARLPLPSATVL